MVQVQPPALESSAPQCTDMLDHLVTLSKTAEGRESILASGALRVATSRLQTFTQAFGADPEEGGKKLLLVLRLLRNVCAAGFRAAALLASCNVAASMARAARQISSHAHLHPDDEAAAQLLSTLAQFLANYAAAGKEDLPGSWGLEQMRLEASPQAALWAVCFPGVFGTICSSAADKTLNPTTAALLSCCRASPHRAAQLCSGAEGAALLRRLLDALLPTSAPEPNTVAREEQLSGQGNEWLGMLVTCLAFEHGLLRMLLLALGDESTEVGGRAQDPAASASSATPTNWRWSRHQAAALHLLAADVGVSQGRWQGPPSGTTPAGASSGSKSEGAGSAARSNGSSNGVQGTITEQSIAAPHSNSSGAAAAAVNVSAASESADAAAAARGQGESGTSISPKEAAADDWGAADAGATWGRSLEALLEVVEAAAASGVSEAGSRVLEAALEAVRSIGQRDDQGAALCGGGDVLGQLLQLGLLRRMLAMLKALGAVQNPRKSQQQPSDLPQAELAPQLKEEAARYPSVAPYPGYRSDLLAIVANSVHQRPDAQHEVLQVGGVQLVLAQCQVDDQSPLAREWALWAVRNLCEDNPDVQRAVAGLQVCTTLETPELQQLGLRLELDRSTGQMRAVRTADSAVLAEDSSCKDLPSPSRD